MPQKAVNTLWLWGSFASILNCYPVLFEIPGACTARAFMTLSENPFFSISIQWDWNRGCIWQKQYYSLYPPKFCFAFRPLELKNLEHVSLIMIFLWENVLISYWFWIAIGQLLRIGIGHFQNTQYFATSISIPYFCWKKLLRKCNIIGAF